MKPGNSYPKSSFIRIFFALFPDQITRKQLSAQADKFEPLCGGRKTKPQHIHLTLLFIGDVDSARIEALKQAATSIRIPKFTVLFDTICYWKHNRIVSLQAAHIPIELLALVNALQLALAGNGFTFDTRDYKPHITLFRKTSHAIQHHSIEPIPWIADEWCLVQSKPLNHHVEYVVLDRWPLQ